VRSCNSQLGAQTTLRLVGSGPSRRFGSRIALVARRIRSK
jgi:hypothetical protein